MTDYFRALCAELVEKLDELNCHYNVPNQSAMIERARTALAEPEVVGPSDEELDDLFTEIDQGGEPLSWLAFARAVLARWGRPAPVPAEGERQAALRAAADRARRGPEHWEGSYPDDYDNGWNEAVDYLTTIADELENADDH